MISLVDVAEVVRESVEIGLHVAGVGQVTRYDAAKQLADVLPLVRLRVVDEEGNVSFRARPIIPNVPVLFLGGGGFRATWPVAAGDTALLVFADSSLDAWLAKGGIADPVGEERHAMTDAVAIVGLKSFAQPWPDAHAANATIGRTSGEQIHFTPSGQIHLNAPATEAVVRGTTYRANEAAANNALASALTALQSALTALSSAVASVGSVAFSGPAAASACAAAAGSVASAISAINTLEAGASGYLSTVVKVK